jgi:polar amino acid transport system substrate-binding protein
MEDLVRAGRIRVGLFFPLYTKDQASGETQGWAVDLARALGARIGVDVVPVELVTPPEVLESLKAGGCDVAFMGPDPSRVADVDLSQQVIQFDFTYLVPAGSRVRSIADADRPGTRIAAVRGHASTLTLGPMLKHTELVLAETPAAAFAMLRGKGLDAMAGIRPVLLSFSTQLAGSRVLEQPYGANSVGMAVPKHHAGRLAYVNRFIEEAKASGMVQRALERAGWRGVEVAPAG